MYHLDFEMSVEDALEQSRFHHQWKPDALRIETGWFEDDVLRELESRGHRLKRVESFGACQAIGLSESGGFSAGHDPRIRGRAKAW